MKMLAAAFAATALLVTGCGGSHPAAVGAPTSSPTPTTFQLTGTITVEASTRSEGTDGGDCYASDGYSDIKDGAQVTVKDGAGAVISLGNLDPGHTVEGNGTFAFKCIFGFTVASVPEGKDFYVVEVSHRGELRYTRADLSAALALSLGD